MTIGGTTPGPDLVGDDGERSLARRIGARLRARRSELELTLADTAARSGLSVSYLSAVEKGVNLPSLPVLARITDALGTSIPAVLLQEGANLVRRARLPAVPGRVVLSHSELQLSSLAVRLAPGGSEELRLPSKDHDLFAFVVEGDLSVRLDSEVLELGAGDALDLRTPATVELSSRQGALAIWTACPTRV